jgi:hypothetical protein
MDPVVRFFLINHSGKVFKEKFSGNAMIADVFPLYATRRAFDFKSNRRRSVCFRITSHCHPVKRGGVC